MVKVSQMLMALSSQAESTVATLYQALEDWHALGCLRCKEGVMLLRDMD